VCLYQGLAVCILLACTRHRSKDRIEKVKELMENPKEKTAIGRAVA
jgi:hypothetical protein